MADNKKPKKKIASKQTKPASRATAKKAPAKKAQAKKAPAKKAPAKKAGRPPKQKTSATPAQMDKAVFSIETTKSDSGELITSVSGVAPQTVVNYAAELITANDVKSSTLRKRMLQWFKRR